MLIRDIIERMRLAAGHGGRAGKVELLTGASRAPATGQLRRIVLLGS